MSLLKYNIEYKTPTSARHPLIMKDENIVWTYMKQCSVCNETFGLDGFPKRVAVANGQKAMCKGCVAKYKASLYMSKQESEKSKRKEYYKKNRAKYQKLSREYYRQTCKESNIKRRLKKRGLTRPQYDQMLVDQNNGCAICFKIFTEGEIAIDHCHETNVVRGLLCDNCNTGLGLFKDSIDSIQRAIKYLSKCKK